MSSGDLKHLLQDLAGEGATSVELDEQQLVPRIQARRRRRAGLVAAAGASTAVVLAATAFAVLPGGEREEPPVATPTPTVTLTGPGRAPLACGASFTADLVGDSSLRFAVAPQEVTRVAEGNYAAIGIQVTNTTGKPLDLFGTPSGPHIVVVKDGVVVATALAERVPGHRWRFDPGQTLTMQALMSTQRCTRDGLPGPTRLEPGSYQVYAMKTFGQYGDDPARDEFVVAGGPWTIQLK